MIKALALRGGDDAARSALAEKICLELERRRFSTALWQQEREDGIPNSSDSASTVIKGSPSQRQITWRRPLDLMETLQYMHADYIIFDHHVQGLPHLLLAPENFDRFALASVGAEDFSKLGRPVFTGASDFSELVDHIVGNTPALLPFPDGSPCCKACGYNDCAEFLQLLLDGEKKPEDCILRTTNLSVSINGRGIPLVEFVQEVIREINLALLGTLNGFEKNSRIEIVIDDRPTADL